MFKFNPGSKSRMSGGISLRPMASLTHLRGMFRRKPGSVLILVIALLVLLALMGTAYISSTRVERYTSYQNSANTQADLLLNGVVSTAQAVVVNDLFDTATNDYRPPKSSSSTFHNYDGAFDKTWLAERIPALRTAGTTYSPNPAIANPPNWPAISLPLINSNSTAAPYSFDQPDVPAQPFLMGPAWDSTTNYNKGDIVSTGTGASTQFFIAIAANTNSPPTNAAPWQQMNSPKDQLRFEPTYKTVGGINYPAFNVYNRISGKYMLPNGSQVLNPSPNVTAILAADADGDGQADSGLWKLPVDQIDGITYYAGVRIIDNSAAVNVNTAGSMMADYDTNNAAFKSGTTIINPCFFPSSVGLQELLNPSSAATEMFNLNVFRFGFPVAQNQNYDDKLNKPDGRADYEFLSQGDELYHQLGRRIDSPGINSASPSLLLQSILATDTLSLASRFCIQNTSISSSSNLETKYLTKSINSFNSPTSFRAAVTPYDPTVTGLWYQQNFDYNNTSIFFPLRPLLVASNSVSNRNSGTSIPVGTVAVYPAGTTASDVINPGMTPYNPPVATLGNSYNPGDWVKYKSLGSGQWGVYRCIAATGPLPAAPSPTSPEAADTALPPAAAYHQSANWQKEPWTPTPTKTSINTATFPELWRSFYNVMCDGVWNGAPGGTGADGGGTAMFKSSIRNTPVPPPPPPPAPLPLGTVNTLTPTQSVQLRAALAAVNAMDLRDTDNDITSRKVQIYTDPSTVPSAPTPVLTANVFGSEKQLFITKVIIVRGPTAATSFVGIELYNPYVQVQYPGGQVATATNPTFYMGAAPAAIAPQVNIGLGCRLGVIDRTTATPQLSEVNAAAAVWTGAPAIPPGGYIFLVSDPGNIPANVTVKSAGQVFAVPGLEQLAFSAGTGNPPQEVVLFRTRDATGAQTTSAAKFPNDHDPTHQYDETNLWDNVPMDQFDAHGAVYNNGDVNVYFRPTQVSNPTAPTAATDYWKCVFPLSPAQVYTPGTGEPTTVLVPPKNITVTDAYSGGAPNPPWHVIQINNNDWPCPYKNAAGKNIYPYGGFARNGDMLQIPFIGAYTLYYVAPGAAPPFTIVECNSISMDAYYAEDSSPDDDPTLPSTNYNLTEQIGRFCPISATATSILPANVADPYEWAYNLFDYFTVQAPHDDYGPDIDPDSYLRNGGAGAIVPVSVANTNSPNTAANYLEDAVPLHGLININTASWNVLATLPLARNADGSIDQADSAAIARMIVTYREQNGPFKSILDLNKVVDNIGAPLNTFQNANSTIFLTPATDVQVPDARQGVLTPNDAANPYPIFKTSSPYGPTSGVTGDFQARFLALTRLSNLITTHSDSFTAYVTLQGWRGDQLVVVRRAALLLDRSSIGYTLDAATGTRTLNLSPTVYRIANSN